MWNSNKKGTYSFQEENDQQDKYPKAVFFILGNEFCERFCYYGMRTILTIYLTEELLYGDSQAKVLFHAFVMLSYFTPLFGAIVADSFLGKFKTILYISIVYAIGNIILSVGSIPNDMSVMKAVSLLGMFIIGVGTGGIKPCVSAFGGDQFSSNQEQQRQRFFSIFYFAINSGSVLSTLATPILRADVKCFGGDSCYPLAYGVPAVLMIVALILFLIGKPFYKMREAEGNVFASVFKCITHAISRKCKSKEKKRSHWLDYADDKFDEDLITDIRNLLHVLWIFIPLPLFWALFDQTGSSWTIQAKRMNGEVGGFHIKPDQMQVMNAIMIIVLIPVFDYGVYPLFNKCNFLKKPLQRIAIGGFLSAVAFVLVGFVELNLERSYPSFPEDGYKELTIINNSPCNVNINGSNQALQLDPFKVSALNGIEMNQNVTWTLSSNCTADVAVVETYATKSSIESMMITLQKEKLKLIKNNDFKRIPDDGEPQIRLYFSTDFEFKNNETSLKLIGERQINLKPNRETYPQKFGATEYIHAKPGKYKIYLPFNDTAHKEESFGEADLKVGGVYIGIIYEKEGKTHFDVYPMAKPSTLSILWQVPAYIVLTTGEIMFSITGLEFSYSQAPKSMKSIVQSAWLLTVAFGNLIVLIIAEWVKFNKTSHELFFFAVFMALDMLGFACMAYFYKYVNSDDDKSPQKSVTSNGKDNKAYDEETDFNK